MDRLHSQYATLAWLVLAGAVLYTAWISLELIRGESKTPKTYGLFQTVGGRKVKRHEEPLYFWLSWCLRAMGIPCFWFMWYLTRMLATET